MIAADFYLRQLTHIERIFEVGGAGMVLMHMVWSWIGPDVQPVAGGPDLYASEISETLDRLRRAAWDDTVPDRPKLLFPRQMPHSAPAGAPEKSERKRRLKDARQRAGRATRMGSRHRRASGAAGERRQERGGAGSD